MAAVCYVNTPMGHAFYVLLLAAHFLILYGKSLQNTHGSNNIPDTRRFLLTESHVSSVIGMDADGLKWILIQDKMTRHHVGFGARNSIPLSHKRVSFYDLVECRSLPQIIHSFCVNTHNYLR